MRIFTKLHFNEGKMAETIREKVHEHEMLVGGFPCQDYSVARTISGELGIKGEKGKLWIPIRNIIRHKRPRPKVVLLENVPRLLNSPANAGAQLCHHPQRLDFDGL